MAIRLTLGGFALLAAMTAAAAIRPSFQPDQSSWVATDVVLVEILEPGRYLVIEPWKGNLTPGSELAISGLAQFSSFAEREIYGQVPPIPTGIHLSTNLKVLFLRRELADGAAHFAPASFWGFVASFAWLQEERVYARKQWMNPGPSVLSDIGLTAEELKERVQRVAARHREFLAAAALADAAERAEALAPFVEECRDPPCVLQLRDTLEALAASGTDGIRVLTSKLRDEKLLLVHGRLAEVLAQSGASEATKHLAWLAARELAFWRAEGTLLHEDWWNAGMATDRERGEVLRARFSNVWVALWHLRKLDERAATKLLLEACELRRSLPAFGIGDSQGLCDPSPPRIIED